MGSRAPDGAAQVVAGGGVDPGTLAVALLNASEDSIIAISLDLRFLSWNRGAERIYGYTAAEVIGKPLAHIVPPAERAAAQENWERAIAGERVGSVEYVRQTKGGGSVVVSVTLSPMRDAAGVVTGAVSIARDITDHTRAKAALADAHARVSEASRLKSEFLANMNHELRTPMNGVIGISSLLADTPLNDDQRELLGLLRVSGEAMMALVNDVLDFSELEGAVVEIADAPLEIRMLVEEVQSIVTATPERTADLVAIFDDGLPRQLLGDRYRIRQILMNLMSNAVKFTAAGTVTIRAAWTPRTSEDGELLIEVADTGRGIDERAQGVIFKAFTQVDGSTTRRHGGTGLGLTIAKELVELMGGEIGVRSTLGAGSTFWFTLPLRVAPVSPTVPAQPSSSTPAWW